MDLSKLMLLPLGFIALVGACVPYPTDPYGGPARSKDKPDSQQTLTTEEQKQLDESRARLKRQQDALANDDNQSSGDDTTTDTTTAPKPKKTNYPTAAAVPGKAGFVFNPYTHSIVDVKGIASGKLVKDPEDADPTHKFRVP